MIDVSVIIPTFNRRQDLPIALDSVFQQAGVRVECIVIDDCSDDGTVGYIRERYKDQPLVVIEKPQRNGAQASRNLGIVIAKGEFITFLDPMIVLSQTRWQSAYGSAARSGWARSSPVIAFCSQVIAGTWSRMFASRYAIVPSIMLPHYSISRLHQ
jgi:hypothetical protein